MKEQIRSSCFIAGSLQPEEKLKQGREIPTDVLRIYRACEQIQQATDSREEQSDDTE